MAKVTKDPKAQKLRVPGTATMSPPVKTEVITVKGARSFAIGAKREASAESPEIVTAPDEVVEIELADGSRFWTTRQRLCDEVLRGSAQRGPDGAFNLPSSLPLRDPSRGLVGGLVIKTLRFFNIDVPKLAALKIAALVEDRGLKQGSDLFRCATATTFKLGDAGKIPTDRPILIFLHGTASSTQGSFGELWRNDRRSIRETLFAPFADNVFAFEHRTLSESPIENAIQLVKKLPKGARLHIVSHSRGGLVGELLCRANVVDNREPFDKSDLEYLKKKDPKNQRGDLDGLNKLLKAKNLHIERFVRVACPARGTSLASERFDLYLSVLFNLIEKIPALQTALDIFSELVMAIAKERTDPSVLPGIEAMIPNSPLIALLNRPGLTVDGELRVIAGDIEGANLAAALSTLVTDPLYLGDHDLVVDTAAMFGGAERQPGAAKFSFHQGAQVSHFRYFVNEDSSNRLVRAITRKPAEDDGFEQFNVRRADTDLPPYKRDVGQPQPVVFLLPGIMGSHLAIGKDRIWIDPVDLAFGGLSRLKIDAPGVIAEAPVGLAYNDFIRFLSHSHDVIPFPYDWRISLLEEASRLADAIEKKLDETEARNHPISIVAHSMGGLLARAMIAQHRGTWDRICKHPDARLIMLGTPNGGSFIVPLVFTARESMVKQLAMVDFTSDQAELLAVLRRFPGLAQMIPAVATSMNFFAADTWKALRGADDKERKWTPPDAALLEQARVFRNLIDSKPTIAPDRMCYVAGQAPATPAALNIIKDDQGNEQIVVEASPEGDGRVLWSTGRPTGVKTWYMPALHGDLADHEPAFAALKELIETGTTDKLSNVAPATRGVPARFELREETSPLYPDGESLMRAALGKATKVRAKTLSRAKVSVVHGNLAFACRPVMVGHYEGDTIISAEASLDRFLGGRLRERLRLGLYPGAPDTEAVVLDPTVDHAGAVVIGLGQVGTLSPGALARAVSRGARAYAVAVSENQISTGRRSLGLSALLIGTGAGGFSTEDSVAAILRGIANANEILTATPKAEMIRIDEIELIELYEDRAIQAAHAVQRMREDAELSRQFDIERNLTIATRRGSRRRVSYAEDAGWWQRLQIIEDKQNRLVFHLLTDRARTQAYLQSMQRDLVDGFIKDAIGQTATDPAIAVTLFEMLIPNELKQRAPEQRDLVLIVNDAAASYPWELMQERRPNIKGNPADAQKPLSVQAGMLRQLQSSEFRERVLTAQARIALVVGDPPSNFIPLPGAVDEAKSVQRKLVENGFEVVSIIRDDENTTPPGETPIELAKDILKQLYAHDYRILHLAGHGVYEFVKDQKKANEPCESTDIVSGMVIGASKFLTPAEIRQMRTVPELVFINCCHLGRTEDKDGGANFPRLAANLATELIRMGVRAVIAAGWAVDDRAAQTFAEVFYGAFLAGTPFGKAVHQARKAIYDAFPHVNTWGAYQCYGDPAFTLASLGVHGTASNRDYRYASPSEAIVELENITEDATTGEPRRIADLQQVVAKIHEHLPPAWLKRGDVQASFGKALGELGLFIDAIQHYRKALRAESAQASIAAAEQMYNLMVRHAKEATEPEARKLIREAKQGILGIIETLGKTAERYNLLGSAEKRQSNWSKTLREKARVLVAMRDAYKQAHRIQTTGGQQAHPYPLLNWLSADILLTQLGHRGESQAKVQSHLQEAESTALKRNLTDPNFWDAVAIVDAKALQYFVEGNLPTHTGELVDLYLSVKQRGSPREFRSVIEQLEFLINTMAVTRVAGAKKQIQSSLKDILTSINK